MDTATIDCTELKKLIREVPDFPKKGILFYDITTLLKDKLGFARLIDALSANYIGKEIDLILGMEARGFIFGPAASLPPQRRIRSRPQARQTPRRHRQGQL
jgi:adenine phosphoribosyltransferase